MQFDALSQGVALAALNLSAVSLQGRGSEVVEPCAYQRAARRFIKLGIKDGSVVGCEPGLRSAFRAWRGQLDPARRGLDRL